MIKTMDLYSNDFLKLRILANLQKERFKNSGFSLDFSCLIS
jgi:hypothetical protein